ncbi:MAG: hypothetical protein R8G66_28970 [Cytophagales bacterium]|nr:hypothetical protein [Cytophagales bacterium]
MKKVILITLTFLTTTFSFAQVSEKQITELTDYLKSLNKDDEAIKEAIDGLIDSPELYNDIWEILIDNAIKSDSVKWKYLDDLNLKFKTFQTEDNTNSTLGLSYDFSFDWANFNETNNRRVPQTFGLDAKGNIAFHKSLNPNDFLESNVNYNLSWFIGGVVKNSDSSIFTELNAIEDKLVTYDDPLSTEALKLWNEFGQKLKLSNQYYFSIEPKFGLESNQDFSKTQLAPGFKLNLGVKSWSSSSKLSKLNVFDYPFALIRALTKADKKFTPRGATIPTIQFGLDYVVPQNDSIREELVGNLDPFLRTKLEASFRTYVSKIKKQKIFFNANFRYYQELSADEAVENADLADNTYYVIALQSSSGFYVSYANGSLPFDAKDDEVYAIGFNYKF